MPLQWNCSLFAALVTLKMAIPKSWAGKWRRFPGGSPMSTFGVDVAALTVATSGKSLGKSAKLENQWRSNRPA